MFDYAATVVAISPKESRYAAVLPIADGILFAIA